ncbi:hypothetical protein C9J03_22265 [Photobacterium gaetbulicola]|uniref:Uncharacterized protein n=1 Tax=Photobacterium gaetbulicola Gung47 TaxID=658445 RepID=A0A0C5WQI7_9GAMM|nr:hypothetical protein [Photobacterium gaetbulicola]AJR08637.1 hypothetical protein H744_2c1973 [Photobacterium gaetbulicola Gung47]PSU02922.1 hypothetical protein C9J03_22265 [Photobacterium gaetbulicola]
MKHKKLIPLAFGLAMTATQVHSAAYGVSLEWKTDDALTVFEGMNAQRNAFSELIEQGVIHDLFVRHSTIDDKQFPIINFVMEADSADQVLKRLEPLPFFKEDIVKVSEIRDIGTKWLDKEVVQNTYALELTWLEPQQNLLVDQILGKDLQKVVNWNAQGIVTSAYLSIQEFDSNMKQPTYSIAVQARDESHAQDIAKELEAVKTESASYNIMYLGYKLNI